MKAFFERILPYSVFFRIVVIKQNLLFNIQVLKSIFFRSKIYNKDIFPIFFSNIDHAWEYYSPQKMHFTLDEIFRKLGINKKLNKVVEFGCGKSHFSPILKDKSEFIYGVDIIDKKLVSNSIDQYIRCVPNIQESYLDEIPSSSVDCIFVLHVSGYGPNKIQNSYTSFDTIINDTSHRTGRYFNDFRRILKKEGLIIIVEWEIHVHLNFNENVSMEQVKKNFDKFYPIPDIKEFEYIFGNLKYDKTGPYIVIKKL
ncbi:class I SAM-dependent methyltransferase [Pelagibacteraceae bacterium]|nr:class I SAM-dependent methyltransferase [Pelagibacteraceae bacterium]